jgi:putative copper export protein
MQLSAWDAAAIGIKAILYAATLSAAGGVFFLFYSAALLSAAHNRSIRRWAGLCTAAALIASVVRLSILAGSMGETAPSLVGGTMLRMVLQAGEARATGIRVAGLLLIASLAITHRPSLLALLGAVIAATSFAWIGHASATGRWSVALLSLHLIAVAFWLGALVPLLIVGADGALPPLARTAKRFGEIAVVGVGVLLLAGTLLLATLLRHFSDLWNTDYGRLVSGKLVAVSMLLGAAAVNKLRFTPRLQVEDAAAVLGLKRSIRAELLLGSLILAITAAFTSLVGPPGLE